MELITTHEIRGIIVVGRTLLAPNQETTMAKKPANSGKKWEDKEVKELKKLAKGNTPTRVIALKLKRTPASVANKASNEDVSLKPTNQSPYNRKKKKG